MGDYRGAFEMDAESIEKEFGSKYDGSIELARESIPLAALPGHPCDAPKPPAAMEQPPPDSYWESFIHGDGS